LRSFPFVVLGRLLLGRDLGRPGVVLGVFGFLCIRLVGRLFVGGCLLARGRFVVGGLGRLAAQAALLLLLRLQWFRRRRGQLGHKRKVEREDPE
jgi:hypothetical protein